MPSVMLLERRLIWHGHGRPCERRAKMSHASARPRHRRRVQHPDIIAACSCTRSSTRSPRPQDRRRSPSTGTASPTSSPSACSSGSAALRARMPVGSRARGWTRREVEDLLFYGVLGVVHRRPARLRAVLQAGLLRRASARDLRGLEGRHVVPRRPARRARRGGAVRARAQAAVPRGDGPGRAVRAARAGRRAHRQLHQRRAVGPLRRPEPAVGDGLSAVGLDAAAPSVAALPVRCSRACCSSCCCGCTRASERRLRPGVGRVPVGYGMFRFIAEYFREPDGFLGLLALGMSMGQWLCVPMIVGRHRALGWARPRAAHAARLRLSDADATDLPRHRNHRPEPRVGRPHHRDRLRRDGEPPPHRPQPALLPQPRARATARTRCKVHGLTDEFLADKPLFAQVADELIEYLGGAEIIIHNAGFDVGFLNEELRRIGRPPLPQHVGARHRQSPWASTTTRGWPTRRWPWRWRCAAAGTRSPASSCTPTRAASTPRDAPGRPVTKWACASRWAAQGRPWTTR